MLVRSPKELSMLVIQQRKKLNLTQEAVAKSVGLKQATISAFENKPESTKLNTLFLILHAVKLDLQTVFKGKFISKEKKWRYEW